MKIKSNFWLRVVLLALINVLKVLPSSRCAAAAITVDKSWSKLVFAFYSLIDIEKEDISIEK